MFRAKGRLATAIMWVLMEFTMILILAAIGGDLIVGEGEGEGAAQIRTKEGKGLTSLAPLRSLLLAASHLICVERRDQTRGGH